MATQAKPARKPRSARPATRAKCARPATPAPDRPEAVPLRARADGWTPARQVAFIEALAATCCVAEAAAAVGLSRVSAYRLRARPAAQQFRLAWDAAIDLGVRALTDASLGRAINGVAEPIFYKGEQIGERRRYDTRLAMFLLRYRDPLRYAASLDQMVYSGHPERAGVALATACNRLMDDANGFPVDDYGPAEIPWQTRTLSEARTDATERAIVEGCGPIHGDGSRRYRLHEARRQHHETLRRAQAGAGAGAGPEAFRG